MSWWFLFQWIHFTPENCTSVDFIPDSCCSYWSFQLFYFTSQWSQNHPLPSFSTSPPWPKLSFSLVTTPNRAFAWSVYTTTFSDLLPIGQQDPLDTIQMWSSYQPLPKSSGLMTKTLKGSGVLWRQAPSFALGSYTFLFTLIAWATRAFNPFQECSLPSPGLCTCSPFLPSSLFLLPSQIPAQASNLRKLSLTSLTQWLNKTSPSSAVTQVFGW